MECFTALPSASLTCSVLPLCHQQISYAPEVICFTFFASMISTRSAPNNMETKDGVKCRWQFITHGQDTQVTNQHAHMSSVAQRTQKSLPRK
ncbi:hypothetical protein RRG08_016700 [Elysia crispata]|uniref:Uncharacterized protein n=1 Tax=Elysia crispata TaxID=231223 RepID=A0AAE1B4W8_9GAST|nr:hypothetical protein RRG08_016700 [Elysia crispata]